MIGQDGSFAETFRQQNAQRYAALVGALARTLIDRDTVCGAEPEHMLGLSIPTLIVPGRDPAHATSAARYLEECIPGADYWDVPVADQTEQSVAGRLLRFLDAAAAPDDGRLTP